MSSTKVINNWSIGSWYDISILFLETKTITIMLCAKIFSSETNVMAFTHSLTKLHASLKIRFENMHKTVFLWINNVNFRIKIIIMNMYRFVVVQYNVSILTIFRKMSLLGRQNVLTQFFFLQVQPQRPPNNSEFIMNRLRSASMLRQKDPKAKTPLNIKILIAGRIAAPVIFGIFNIVYWSVALRYAEHTES